MISTDHYGDVQPSAVEFTFNEINTKEEIKWSG